MTLLHTQHSSGRMKPTPSTCLACAMLSFTPACSFLSGPAARVSSRLAWSTSGASSFSPSHPIRHALGGAAGSQARGLALRMVATPEVSTTKAPGTAGLDWENLGFEYRDGKGHDLLSLCKGKQWPISCVVPGASGLAMHHYCCHRGMVWCFGKENVYKFPQVRSFIHSNSSLGTPHVVVHSSRS